MMFVKTPCKLQGIMKKLLIQGKDMWEDWFWMAERKGKVRRDNEECSSGGIFFSFHLLPLFGSRKRLGMFPPRLWRFVLLARWSPILCRKRAVWPHWAGVSTMKLRGFCPECWGSRLGLIWFWELDPRLVKSSFSKRPMKKLWSGRAGRYLRAAFYFRCILRHGVWKFGSAFFSFAG